MPRTIPCSSCRLPIPATSRSGRCHCCRRQGTAGYSGHLFDADHRPRERVRRHPCHYPYVRKVRGRKYQLRIYLGLSRTERYAINLGLYDSEWLAGQALRRVAAILRGERTPLEIWQAVRPLCAEGVLPAGLMPMWVVARDGAYWARRRKSDPLAGPFPTPEAAHLAICDPTNTHSPGAACAIPAAPPPDARQHG